MYDEEKLEQLLLVERVLGTAMRDPSTMERLVRAGVDDAVFENLNHKIVWNAMIRCFVTHKRADGALVDDVFRHDGILGPTNERPRKWIEACESAALSTFDDETLALYIERLRYNGAINRFLDLSREVTTLCSKRSDVGDIATFVTQGVEGIIKGVTSHRAKKSADLARRYTERMMRAKEMRVVRVPIGFPVIDKLNCGGCRMGSVVLVGADTGVGKTTFMCHMILSLLERGLRVFVWCFESTADEIHEALVNMRAGVTEQEATTGTDWSEIAKANAWLSEAPLEIDDVESITAEELSAKMHTIANDEDERDAACFVDYVQDVERSTRFSRDDLNYAHISKTLRKATLRARRGDKQRLLSVWMSQLNDDDGPDDRKKGRAGTWEGPQLKNVAFSKQFSKDASYVLMLDRNKNSDDEELRNRTRVRQIKVRPRDSRPGKTWMQYDPRTTRIGEVDASGRPLDTKAVSVEVEVPDAGDDGWDAVANES